MRYAASIARFGLAAGFLVGFQAHAADNDTVVRITVTGSSTIAPLMADIAKSYDAKNVRTKTDVQSGGTSRGIADTRKGTAQIGMVSRSIYPDEKDLRAVLIARDGVAMIVHKSNTVEKLTRAQVIDIYSGKTRNWREFGGPDLPITVISKAEGRSTLEIFTGYFDLTYRQIKAHAIVGDNQQEIMTVAGNKGAVGYVSIGSAEYEQKNGSSIKLVRLDDYVPSTANVASGAYPLARELNLVYRDPPAKEVKALVDFAASPAVKSLITTHFFVPVAARPSL
jgi:phosphate transport system substrate-binding protein